MGKGGEREGAGVEVALHLVASSLRYAQKHANKKEKKNKNKKKKNKKK